MNLPKYGDGAAGADFQGMRFERGGRDNKENNGYMGHKKNRNDQ